MTEEPPERRNKSFNWRGLIFIVIGMALLAAAAILMVSAFGHPGAAAAGVIRPPIARSRIR